MYSGRIPGIIEAPQVLKGPWGVSEGLRVIKRAPQEFRRNTTTSDQKALEIKGTDYRAKR